jgi:hypothetical protein
MPNISFTYCSLFISVQCGYFLHLNTGCANYEPPPPSAAPSHISVSLYLCGCRGALVRCLIDVYLHKLYSFTVLIFFFFACYKIFRPHLFAMAYLHVRWFSFFNRMSVCTLSAAAYSNCYVYWIFALLLLKWEKDVLCVDCLWVYNASTVQVLF